MSFAEAPLDLSDTRKFGKDPPGLQSGPESVGGEVAKRGCLVDPMLGWVELPSASGSI